MSECTAGRGSEHRTGSETLARGLGGAAVRAVAVTSLVSLMACGDRGDVASRSVSFVERDVEAPGVFQATEPALWDGSPSLGGVWVSHPSATGPERVIVRNPENGKFVIGTLFPKPAEPGGVPLRVSSDAAGALGLRAREPQELNVTALRPEGGSEARAAPPPPSVDQTEDDIPPIGIDDAPAQTGQAPQAPRNVPSDADLSKPFVQIGIFSVEANARNTVARMADEGLPSLVKEEVIKDKPFWRVLVGPARSEAERDRMLTLVKEDGFADAFAVAR